MNCFTKFVNICIFFTLVFFSALVPLNADDSLLDSNLEELFDEKPENETSEYDEKSSSSGSGFLRDFIMGTGFGIDTSYSMTAGYMPGWTESPWFFEDGGDSADKPINLIGAKMSATVGLDIQPSRHLRIRQSFSFAIPSPALTIKEFFFDYSLNDRMFVKVGKYDVTWGVSPNFPFANLLARIPLGLENPGEPYLAKLNIPIGIGGLEGLLLTRPGYIDTASPRLENFGSGVKYNMALRNLDMDIGFFYFELMPLRNFISLKTTLFGNIEMYTETMINIFYDKQIEEWSDFGFSGSLGFIYGLLGDRLKINGEVYYNGEGDAASLRRNNILNEDPEDFRLFSGFNVAFNLSYKPAGGRLSRMHIFLGCLYAFEKKSGQLVPGISFDPVEHIELYFAVPMAVGAREENSYYYHNADTNNRPFSIVLAVKIKGTYKYGHFE